MIWRISQKTNHGPDELPRSILASLPLEDLFLKTTTVSLGFLLDEAWNAEPFSLHEFLGQGTDAPIHQGIMLVDDVQDCFHVRAILAPQVWLAF